MNRTPLILFSATFLTVAIGAWVIPPSAVGPSGSAMSQPQLKNIVKVTNKPGGIEDFAELGERPPFSATRRAILSTPDDNTALVLGRYRLSGVIVSPGDRSVILSGLNNRSLIVAEGETVDSWTVDEITAEKVVFTSGDRRQVFPVDQFGR